jgi:CDP-diacylglycerol--glycerol-3-phosphate 3-phosphatidyltransferase
MNLPNKLTILRVCLIPVFLVLYPYSVLGDPLSRYLAVAVFIIASLTDMLDGHIARKRNLVTNFGKLMDPMADKLLVSSALIAMVQMGALPAWAAVVIIGREFFISGFRMLALEKNVVIAASKWGKAKTISQIVMIALVMLGWFPNYINMAFMAIALVLTVVSAVDYVAKNAHLIKEL